MFCHKNWLMNKMYYWQKTEKCSTCVFNDDPGACHYYGYRFWPELPLADDCWQYLTAEQWGVLLKMGIKDSELQNKSRVLAKWDEYRRRNHPDLPPDYRPPYTPTHIEKD